MQDNPFQSPKSPGTPVRRRRGPWLDENVKEMLGVSKNDLWYYPAFGLLVAACFFNNVALVMALFAVSTFFTVVYLVKSFPKYVHSPDLALVIRIIGFAGCFAAIGLQIGVVAVKSWTLFRQG